MDRALGSVHELWLRQVWYVRLRWIVPALIVASGFGVELVIGRRLFPPLLAVGMVGLMAAVNAFYRALLHRFGHDLDSHVPSLRLLAHVQVIIDLIVGAAAIYLSGGSNSPFWPFMSLTVMAATLLFMRRLLAITYGALTVALYWVVSGLGGGGAVPLNVLLLAALVSMVVIICSFYVERMAESRQLLRSKEEILSRVTHELRTPLSALRGFVYLAKKRTDETPSTKLGQTLVRIDAQVDRLARMVGDLYDVSAVQAGKLKVEPRTCDLVAIVREVALRFRTLHPKVNLRWNAPEALWGQWDALRIDQLLSNLVGNAIKYGGETTAVEIAVLEPPNGGAVQIEVRDDGPGIPADKLAVIFEPFERVDQPGPSGGKKGLGLGLSIAREIALLHGGAIWVDSQVGRGTTFHVRLPVGKIRAPS
jgi:signal transduction histidine kinase